jgi:hypothetical protein
MGFGHCRSEAHAPDRLTQRNYRPFASQRAFVPPGQRTLMPRLARVPVAVERLSATKLVVCAIVSSMPRGPYESLDDYQRRRRGTPSIGERLAQLGFVAVVAGSTILGATHRGWVRIGLFGVVPAIMLVGVCAALSLVRALRFVIAPIGFAILFGFPALWAESVLYALTGSRFWSTGVAIVVLFATPSMLLALQRWGRRLRQDKRRREAGTTADDSAAEQS